MTKSVIVAAMAALAVSAATTLPAMTDYGSPRYGMGSWAAPYVQPGKSVYVGGNPERTTSTGGAPQRVVPHQQRR